MEYHLKVKAICGALLTVAAAAAERCSHTRRMKWTISFLWAVALSLLTAFGAPPELVMQPGMKITAETKAGIITIVAPDRDLNRTYTWEGASRTATLWPRKERWHGSLGAYYPGPGEHWRKHNRITRGVLQEGQQHFESLQEAIQWLEKQSVSYPTVHRDDGLVVSFGKTLPRRQINVEVWQIFVRGAKPATLPNSDNARITVTNPENE